MINEEEEFLSWVQDIDDLLERILDTSLLQLNFDVTPEDWVTGFSPEELVAQILIPALVESKGEHVYELIGQQMMWGNNTAMVTPFESWYPDHGPVRP